MRKVFFGIISILVIAGLAWFFFWQKQMPATAPGEKVGETSEKAWVEVVNRGVYLVNADGTLGSELKTGDEVQSGQTLMTDNVGLANLYFSDGSVVRLETQTKIDLKDFEYFSGNKTLKVKIFLQSGRIWSRIKALMTTQSYWEVQTANAVAAVRGTSFGVVYVPGQTTIIGSVHLINVNAVDPQTKQLIEHNTAYVGEEQYIKINDQDIAGLKREIKLTSKIKPYTQAIINDAWVIKSKSQDEKLGDQTLIPTTNTSSIKEEKIVSSTEKPTEDVGETSDFSIIQRDGGSSTTVIPDETTETQNQSDNQSPVMVEEDFYSSIDYPTNENTTVDSDTTVTDPTGAAAPTDFTNSNINEENEITSDTTTTTITPNLKTNSTLTPTTTVTTTKTMVSPITNLRTTNLVR